MLETWNLEFKYRHIPSSGKITWILFFFRILKENLVSFLSNIIGALLKDFLILFWAFVRLKFVINAKLRIIDHALGVLLPDCCKSGVNRKKDYGIICRHDVIANLYKVIVFLVSWLDSSPRFKSILSWFWNNGSFSL